MKFEAKMFGYIGIFLMIDIPVYWYLSKDTVGTTALSMAFGLCALVWFYLYFTAIRIGPRPEDRDDAEISEMAGELGFFSPHSWWPLFAAGSAAIVFMGIIFGWWLLIFGLPFLAFAVVGLVFEYYRRENNRYGEHVGGH